MRILPKYYCTSCKKFTNNVDKCNTNTGSVLVCSSCFSSTVIDSIKAIEDIMSTEYITNETLVNITEDPVIRGRLVTLIRSVIDGTPVVPEDEKTIVPKGTMVYDTSQSIFKYIPNRDTLDDPTSGMCINCMNIYTPDKIWHKYYEGNKYCPYCGKKLIIQH